MFKLLLVLSPGRESVKALERAVLLAKEKNATLVVLYVTDTSVSNTVIKKLSEEGWIGGDPSKELRDSLELVYEMQASEKIKEIREYADKHGVSIKPIIHKGEFEDEVLKVIAKEKIDMAILTRKKRLNLFRLLFGSAVENITKLAKCPVEILD